MKTKEKQIKGNMMQQPQQQQQVLYQKEIQCHYHPNEKLKYFCKKADCLQPLCKICLDIHIEEHQEQNDTKQVVSYEKCLAEVSKNMSDNLEQFQNKIGQLQNHIERIINFKFAQNWMNLIQSSENQIIDLIRSYFNNLRSYLFSISPEINKVYSAQDRLLVCSKRLDQLRSELENLRNENSVTQLILFYQGDVEKLNNKYLQYLEQTFEDLQKIDFCNMKAPKILINHNKLNNFLEVLNQYINYENEQEDKELEQEKQVEQENEGEQDNEIEEEGIAEDVKLEDADEEPINMIMAQKELSDQNQYGYQSNEEEEQDY